MTVAEFIEYLKTVDQDAKVKVQENVGDFYQHYVWVELTRDNITAHVDSYKGYCHIGG